MASQVFGRLIFPKDILLIYLDYTSPIHFYLLPHTILDVPPDYYRHLLGQPATKMKFIIGGSTGFVGAELVRQALLHPAITSVVGLSRRETPIPPGIDGESASRLKSVACDDFEKYPDAVMSELQDADACIW